MTIPRALGSGHGTWQHIRIRARTPTEAAMFQLLSIYLNACARCAWLVMLALDEASEALAKN